MLSFSPCWFGASQKFVALACGTNNIDPFATNALTEAYQSVGSARQLVPVFNKVTNEVTVQFPTIPDTFANDLKTLYPDAYPQDGDGFGGGVSLDLCNSTIGTDFVSWIDSGNLRDDKQTVKEIDGQFANMLPTASPNSVASVPQTKNGVSTMNIVVDSDTAVGRKMEAAVGKRVFEKLLGIKVGGPAYDQWVMEKALRKEAIKKRYAERYFKKYGTPWDGKDFSQMIVTERESPSTVTAIQVATTAELPLDTGTTIENMIITPIAAYEPPEFGVEVERFVHSDPVAYKTGSLSVQSWMLSQNGTANAFVKDPTSTQGTEISDSLIKMSKGLSTARPDWGGVIEDVVNVIPGRAGTIARGVYAIGESIAGAVKKRRAKRKAKQQSR
jgi:hypothetical protein